MPLEIWGLLILLGLIFAAMVFVGLRWCGRGRMLLGAELGGSDRLADPATPRRGPAGGPEEALSRQPEAAPPSEATPVA